MHVPRPVIRLASVFTAASATLHAAPFTQGNLAVLQADAASSKNTTATIVELSPTTPNQTPTHTIAIAGTGADALRFSGSAASTGYLVTSADGGLICFCGHNSADTSSNVNTLTTRGVGTLNPSSTFALQTTYTGSSGNQTRSANTFDNSTWIIGDQGGIYSNLTAAPSPSGNCRAIKIFGGSTYVLQTTGTVISTLSAASGGTLTGLPGLPSTSDTTAQDYYLISSGSNGTAFDVLYEVTATSDTAGAIKKYSLVSGSWVANGSYTTAFGGFGLAAAKSGGGAKLYVTTGGGAVAANKVMALTDTTGFNATISVTTASNVTLYTAGAAATIKGIAFAPAVIPAAPLITSQPPSETIPGGTTTILTTSASGVPTPTFQWYQGTSPDTSNPVTGATTSSFTTPALATTTSYWVRATNTQGSADSATAVITTFSGGYNSTNRTVLSPNLGTWDPAGTSLGGTSFVNLGLQGVGRFPANSRDPVTGETIGSISDMQVSNFVNNHDGTWGGTFNFLPDHGYNNGSIQSNYAARINAFTFTFAPYTGSTAITAQNQIAMTFAGSTRFTYDHDNNPATAPVFTTGLNSDSKVTLFGTQVPATAGSTPESDATVTNRFTLDTESLALDRRPGKSGSGWVGDEYGAFIYHFNAAKQIDGLLQLPSALIPHKPVGTVSFDGTPTNGRRDNQGFEGMTHSPSGNRLFGLLQSATIQDSGSGNANRSNARLVVYDTSSSDIPAAPVAQYVIQLPLIDDTGLADNGTSIDRTGSPNCILALNDHQLLILNRDSNGRGATGAPVFKSVLLADLSTATNINGLYDAEGAAVAPSGVLNASVTPIPWTEALNLIGKLSLGIPEIAKFGLNLNAAPGDVNTLCEKWESMGLASVNDPAYPNDYFLFIGNDNDFSATSGKYLDANGILQNYAADIDIDTMVLAFRVRIVQSVPPLVIWRQTHFLVTSEAGILAGNADYDSDGLTNLLEYGLATDPTIATGTNGLAALPAVIRHDADPLLSDRLALGFTVPNPSPTDLTYLVQSTDDLTTWTDVASKSGSAAWSWLAGGTPHIVSSDSGTITNMKVGDSVPSDGAHPKRMMRLKVTNP